MRSCCIIVHQGVICMQITDRLAQFNNTGKMLVKAVAAVAADISMSRAKLVRRGFRQV